MRAMNRVVATLGVLVSDSRYGAGADDDVFE